MGWSRFGGLRSRAAGRVIAILCAIAGAYQLIALAACLSHRYRSVRSERRRLRFPAEDSLAVSVLKPIHGLHGGFDEALKSHATQQYSKFELLLGYSDPQDSALPEIQRIIAEHPTVDIRAIHCPQSAPNRKVGVLIELANAARYPLLIVNDADIAVPQNYLQDIAVSLGDPSIGLVTCIYRAEGDSWPSRWEALGVVTDFAPSTLVAPFVGVSEFALGSTLAFRRADLDRIGGFAAVADYLADDYQLGCKLHALGLGNVISTVVVRTRLHGQTWGEVWRHQLRWARTIRISRKGGYMGLPVTFATAWAIAAAAAGLWWAAIALMAIRLAMGITGGWLVLRSRDVLKLWYLIPLRDLYGVAVWIVAFRGHAVEWGGEILNLDRQGRILRRSAAKEYK